MRASVWGLGLWLPPDVRCNDAWPPSFVEEFAARHRADFTRVEPASDAIGAIAARHAAPHERDPFRGTRRRHVARDVLPSEAEAHAGAAALADARVDPLDVDVVLSHSLVPDRLTPPNAPLVAHRLGLRRATAFGLDAVCASALAQLIVGAALIESGRARHVLLVQSHLVSPTLDYAHPASVFLGDAASALVLGPGREGSGEIGPHVAVADGALHGGITWERRDPSRWWEAGGAFVPGSSDRDAVRAMSARLLHFGVETLSALTTFDSKDVLVCFQPTAWYPSALAEALGLAHAPSTFERLGHVGACGVVANLIRARAQGLLRPGARTALYAHGAGVNRAGVLLRWGAPD